MGWNQVKWREGSHLSQVVGRNAQQPEFFYFVHSYCVQPSDSSIVAAETDYGGMFCSAVSRGRLLATQFHPEKSQSVGMRLLKYFIEHV
jgi:glutamine amidotransferase